MIPITKQAHWLMHQGAIALSHVEQTGIQIDVEYCRRIQQHLTRQIARLDSMLAESSLGKVGYKRYGAKLNLNSDPQLAKILFTDMGFKPVRLTESSDDGNENYSVDRDSLAEIDLPEIKHLVQRRKLAKTRDTYIGNFIKEQVDGVVHPFFHLNTTRTFRPSTSAPNFANIPKRDPEIQKICRRAIIPRPGCKILSMDFSGIEVRIATCYHKDPTMIAYNKDPSTDMHRDMAMEIYLLEKEQVTKPIRHSGKNEFVFPEFYGDWYGSCAPNLWKSAHKSETHTLKDGRLLAQYLKAKGLTTENKFTDHLKKVEDNFWNKRFKVYSQWKKDWWAAYQKKGFFETLTGFYCQGVMWKNDAINYPIQGSAFHCMLYSLIKLDEFITKYKMKSRIINQIYDDIMANIYPDEEKDIVEYSYDVMTRQLPKEWPWIIVPLDVETQMSQVDGNWYEMEKI